MPQFEPTSEQSAIVLAAKESQDNILISALAGAAKTTTLQLIAERLTGIPTLSVAFNKRIAEDMAKRLPPHVVSATLNSVGHRIWMKATSKRIELNKDKNSNNLREAVSALPRPDQRDVDWSEIMKGISRAKSMGYFPQVGFLADKEPLIHKQDFYDLFDEEPDEMTVELIDTCVIRSIQQAYDGLIDFDDQIYMPSLFGGTFPEYPITMVDEAQDLNLINHAFIEKLVRRRRIFAVGDRNQSIYGFRGAAVNSMDLLVQRFRMKEMELSISFRCPKRIVELARKRAPTMQYPTWAIDGVIEDWNNIPREVDGVVIDTEPATWNVGRIPDHTAVICRNNAPLLKLALILLRAGRGCRLVGSDLGPQLLRTLKKLGEPQMTKEDAFAAVSAWEAERDRKSRNKGLLKDKADCLRVFVDFGTTLGDAIAYAEHLFAATGTILLMTGHKSKGLEFEDVLFLDSWLVPSPWAVKPESVEQELNVEYVIQTRTKNRLIYADLETLR